jgi:excisionase family DNA binding protein
MTEKLLTAEQLAQLIGLKPRSILAMARRGSIPSVRVGERAVRFRLEDVAERRESRSRAVATRTATIDAALLRKLEEKYGVTRNGKTAVVTSLSMKRARSQS